MKAQRIQGKSGRLRWWLVVFVLVLALAGSVSAEIIPTGRRVTWQGNVGVTGDIPTNRVNCTTSACNTLYGGTVTTDSINAAISSAPANTVVRIPRGTFNISGTINMKSNVTLRGSAMGVTTLKGTPGFSGNQIIGLISANSWNLSSPASVNLSSGYTKGSTSLSTSTAHGLSPGDIIFIDEIAYSDPPLGNNYQSYANPHGTNRAPGQVNRVVTTPTSTSLTLEIPLYWTLHSSQTPQLVRITNSLTGVGLEDFTINNQTSRVSKNILIQFADNSWLLRVECNGSLNDHVHVYFGYRLTVRSCYFHAGIPEDPDGGNQYQPSHAYSFNAQPYMSASLIEDNIFYHVHIGIAQQGVTSGNVYAYNYIAGLRFYGGLQQVTCRAAIGDHATGPTMNLLEGNYMDGKFMADNINGVSAWETMFRNKQFNTVGKTQLCHGVDLWDHHWYFNAVGNVLGTAGNDNVYLMNGQRNFNYDGDIAIYLTGYGPTVDVTLGNYSDSNVNTSMLRHMNYDYVNKAIKYCTDSGEPGCQGGDGSHTLPNSLYLSSKPSFFGSCAWPPIDPAGPTVYDIPAKRRYDGNPCGAGKGPQVPQGSIVGPTP